MARDRNGITLPRIAAPSACVYCGSDDDVRVTDLGYRVCWIHDDRPADNGAMTCIYGESDYDY